MKILISKKKQRPLDGFDAFQRADGGMGFSQDIYGYQWLGSNAWSVKNGMAKTTPRLGTELLTNPSFDVNTTGWTFGSGSGTSTAGGAINNCLLLENTSAAQARAGQQMTLPANRLLQFSAYHKNGLKNGNVRVGVTSGGFEYLLINPVDDTLWKKRVMTPIITAENPFVQIRVASSVLGDTTFFDEASANEINLADTINTWDIGQVNAHLEARGTLSSMGFAGVAACLDSNTNPKNGIFCFHNGPSFGSEAGYNTLAMWKLINGVWTQLVSQSVTYVSGVLPNLRVIQSGSTVLAQAYYNGVMVGLEQAIGGVENYTQHGIFSTREENLFSYFSVKKL